VKGRAAEDRCVLVPARPAEGFARVFAWYVRRLLTKDFEALRAIPGSLGVLESLARGESPAIVVMSHASWWDPLVGFHLHRLTASEGREPRAGLAPMDAKQLARFGFFRKLGVFGVDPDDRRSAGAMVEYARERFAERPRTTLWITAQGRFTDPREAVTLRPGAAMVAARTPGVRVACLAVEYAFWQERKPGVFLACEEVGAPVGDGARSSGAWQRAMTAGLARVAGRLASAVIERDPVAFEHVGTARGGRVNPAFDLWQRLRGRGGAIEAGRGGRGGRGERGERGRPA